MMETISFSSCPRVRLHRDFPKVKREKNIWRGQQLRSQPLEIHSGKDPAPGELEIL